MVRINESPSLRTIASTNILHNNFSATKKNKNSRMMPTTARPRFTLSPSSFKYNCWKLTLLEGSFGMVMGVGAMCSKPKRIRLYKNLRILISWDDRQWETRT
jgi:hypothetical protein